MSRKQTREREAAARRERKIAEFNRARADLEVFRRLLTLLAACPKPLWPFAELAAGRDRPLDEVERVMIQEAIAPHLVRMKPGTAHERIAREAADRESRVQA